MTMQSKRSVQNGTGYVVTVSWNEKSYQSTGTNLETELFLL